MSANAQTLKEELGKLVPENLKYLFNEVSVLEELKKPATIAKIVAAIQSDTKLRIFLQSHKKSRKSSSRRSSSRRSSSMSGGKSRKNRGGAGNEYRPLGRNPQEGSATLLVALTSLVAFVIIVLEIGERFNL